jgi:prepilin-type N-terminal cleavage/methylation domain-containing protein
MDAYQCTARGEVRQRMQIKHTRGFTLVELLIALMIMGMITAIAVPRFRGLIQNYTLMNAARVVWLDLHRAKMMAIKQGRAMRVDFTPTAYHIVRVDTAVVVFSRHLSVAYPRISFDTTATTPSVSFGSTGTANGGTIVIQRSPTRSKHFTIALTGRIGQIL